MTSPRINENTSPTDSPTFSTAVTEQPSIGAPTNPVSNDGGDAESGGGWGDWGSEASESALSAWHAATGTVREVASDAVDAVSEEIDEKVTAAREGVEGVKATLREMTASAGDRVRNMKDGQTAVIDFGAEISAHDGAGGELGIESGWEVERQGDEYTATFTVDGELNLGGGAEIENVGASVDGSGAMGRRVVITGRGPKARDAIATLVEESAPGELGARVAANDDLDIVRDERLGGLGASIEAGVGVASAAADGSMHLIQGTVRHNGRPQDLSGVEVRRSVGIQSPGVETTPEAAAKLIKASVESQLPGNVDVSEEIIQRAIEANGGLVGLELSADVTTRVERVGDEHAAAETTMDLHIGGTTYTVEATAELGVTVTQESIRRFQQSSDVTDALQGELEWTVSSEVTDFEGFEVRHLPLSFRNGYETSTPGPAFEYHRNVSM